MGNLVSYRGDIKGYKTDANNLAVVKPGGCEIKSLARTQMMVKLVKLKESEGKL